MKERENVTNGNSKKLDTIKYERCQYCGSPLNHVFYFCTVCATPYRPISEVIPPVLERPLTESELIHEKTPNVWRVFWSYAVVIFIVGLLSHVLFEGEQQRVNILIFGSICILITTIVFEVIFWHSLVVQLKQFHFFTLDVGLGFLLLILLLALNFGYHSLIFHLMGDKKQPDVLLQEADLNFGAMFLLVCLIPGITEEIAFRGLIQHWLHTVLRPWKAIVLASALFTALHLSVISAPYIFLLGILLGWVKWKSRSLYPSILMHIVHNCVCITVFPYIMK